MNPQEIADEPNHRVPIRRGGFYISYSSSLGNESASGRLVVLGDSVSKDTETLGMGRKLVVRFPHTGASREEKNTETESHNFSHTILQKKKVQGMVRSPSRLEQ